jgi:hypothetical protein
MLYFCLIKEREIKREKIAMEEEDFSRAESTLLAVQWVSAARCN